MPRPTRGSAAAAGPAGASSNANAQLEDLVLLADPAQTASYARIASSSSRPSTLPAPPITEDAILELIRARYGNGSAALTAGLGLDPAPANHHQFFTRVGSSALVVVNPVTQENAATLCSDAVSKVYSDWARDSSSPDKAALPAHIFDLATSVFLHMLREQQDQSVLFCGESGSGKSESRKLFVRQLCALSKSAKKKSRVISGALKTETILEAFGNARTADNTSSSRFGRYTEYQFDEAGKLIGAKLLDYLLEKSRVVSVPQDERNFNVFYQLMAGASPEERSSLRLPTDTSHFHYLNPASTTVLSHRSTTAASLAKVAREDAARFATLKNDLKSVGVGKRQQAGLMQTLAAILHLGQIAFHDDPNKPGEACDVKNYDVLVFVSELLGVLPVNLEYALTYKTKLIRKELCTVYLTAADAGRQRDFLAKTLYSLVFAWVIEHLNSRLDMEDSATFVGVVDLSGFQDYKLNGFEQLLYNHANERLQHFASRRALHEPHAEYDSEGLPSLLGVLDRPNQLAPPPALSLVGGAAVAAGDDEDEDASNVIHIIDAESFRSNPKKADTRIGEVLSEELSSRPGFVADRKGAANLFGIRHYAGTVSYDVRGFSERNTDALSPDFVTLFRGNGADIQPTSNNFVRSIFSESAVSTAQHPRDGAVLASAQVSQKPLRHPSLKRKGAAAKAGAEATGSVASSFVQAMSEMLETLTETVPWFVYCIKPNEDLTNATFDARTVKAQLSYMGIQDLAISRSAADYTTSYLFSDFITRYRVIVEPMRLDSSRVGKNMCKDFVASSNWTAREMAVGTSRVFLSEAAWRSLEDELRTIEDALREEQRTRKKNRNSMASGNGSVAGGSVRSGSAFGDGHDVEGSNYSASEAGDGRGYFDEDGSYAGDDNESHYGSEFKMADGGRLGGARAVGAGGDVEMGNMSARGAKAAEAGVVDADGAEVDAVGKKGKKGKKGDAKKKMTPARCRWLCLTWCLTWWVPIFPVGNLKRPDIRMAYREKVALCIIIFFMCCLLLFFIIVFGQLICPRQQILSLYELASYQDVNKVWVAAYGRVLDINDVVSNHVASYGMQKYSWQPYAGTDVSQYFYKPLTFEKFCPGLQAPSNGWDNIAGHRGLAGTVTYPYHYANSSDGTPRDYTSYMNQYARARVGWTYADIKKKASTDNKLIVIYDNVYDVSAYYNANNNFLGTNMQRLFDNFYGQDASKQFNDIRSQEGAGNAAKYLNCMNNMFYIGTIDHRNDFRCQFSNYILLATTVFIVAVILIKFLSALQFGSARDPEEHDKFVILQVPCYTEGAESLTKTLESLALLKYDDKRKLLFIVADGMIIGSGNDRPTPRIVLDILGVDPNIDPEPQSFQSLGEGDKQLNMGKVYSGLYETHGRSVPFIVVVKVGKPSERARPGNRGKRDSQLVLMRFLNRVHFNAEMSPLELELYHNMKNVIGVNPSFYEYILMVDADTEVYPTSLNRLISTMIADSRIMGLCGETLISNEKDSFTTMIQVYEYFISHHLAKAFESLFGSVTCLPGCFCMYRVRTPTKNIPLLISPAIIEDYSENEVDTLHLKNLLHLGEDRYLTTLMMKNFPNFKLCFTADAKCKTVVPERWPVLLSQRRRWINSTIHNLVELVMLPQLCGFCFFSMRFIVFLDLFSTVVQPAALIYIGYLIYECVESPSNFPLISVVMIAVIYGLQVIIFIIKRQWAQIGWMLIYILATPVFSFYIPVYAFWRFDDFSWGNTRVVVGEKGKKVIAADVVPFDPKTIPQKKWADHEKDLWEKSSERSDSRASDFSENRSMKHAMTPGYASAIPPTGSVYGGPHPGSGSVYGAPTNPHMSMNPGSVYGVPPSMYAATAPAGSVYGAGSAYGPPPGAPGSMYGGAMSPYAGSVAAPGSIAPPAGNRFSMYSNGSGGSPTDDDILREVRRILATANLMTVTKKQVRDELGQVFGMDLTSRKATINQFIEEILQGRL
ncbi:hypothetical protein HK101_008533 [Irineochytrium annulatum]|nr:hypothetical protein HK101_008533 [Irineochytrium annulatum]